MKAALMQSPGAWPPPGIHVPVHGRYFSAKQLQRLPPCPGGQSQRGVGRRTSPRMCAGRTEASPSSTKVRCRSNRATAAIARSYRSSTSECQAAVALTAPPSDCPAAEGQIVGEFLKHSAMTNGSAHWRHAGSGSHSAMARAETNFGGTR